MKMFKSLFTFACLLGVTLSSQAIVQTFTVGNVANINTNLINYGTRINSITITPATTSGNNVNYAIVNWPGTNTAYGWYASGLSNGGYMTSFSYLTNITRITTNFTGITYTNIFTNAFYTYTNWVGGSTSAWPILAVGTVASNSTVTITPANAYHATFGVGITNNAAGAAVTVTIDHSPDL